MRAAVSSLLSAPAIHSMVSRPDYQQTVEHHRSLLVLLKPLGKQLKTKLFQRICEKVNEAASNFLVTDSNGRERPVIIRFITEYSPDLNDWGEFQCHRRLLGLITFAVVNSQTEINEIFRQHESLKVKYSSTLYDSRCILIGVNRDGTFPSKSSRHSPADISPQLLSPNSMTDSLTEGSIDHSESSLERLSTLSSPTPTDTLSTASPTTEGPTGSNSSDVSPGELSPPDSLSGLYGGEVVTTPSNFKTRALYYRDEECILQAISGTSTFILDDDIKEYIAALFWVLEHKRLERSREKLDRVTLLLAPFERKDIVGLDLESRANKKRCVGRGTKNLADLTLQAGLPYEACSHYVAAIDLLKAANDWLWLGGAYEGLCSASSIILFPQQKGSDVSLTYNSYAASNSSLAPQRPIEIHHCLSSEEICKKYREAITHYSKYLHASVLETEACFKAARIAVAQNKRLQASSFLQNVILINLNLTEDQKIERFLAIADLYSTLGFKRKSSFYNRLAGTRYVSAQNPNPDWSKCYHLLLQAVPGLKLSLDPLITGKQQSWTSIQVQILQELVAASRRMGSPQVAVRHLTFILQAVWNFLSINEKNDLSMQLQAVASQCEGAPVPLTLPNTDIVLPPANLVQIPHISCFEPLELDPALRPRKIGSFKIETGPFLFTPMNFGQSDQRGNTKDGELGFIWVEGDKCEVSVSIYNPLSTEIQVSDMRILTEGPVFESCPATLSIPGTNQLNSQQSPEQSMTSFGSSSQQDSISNKLSIGTHTVHNIILTGIPRDSGELIITGYSTHVLGVKSVCNLSQLPQLGGINKYSLKVVPALPNLKVFTNTLQEESLEPEILSSGDHLTGTINTCIYAGETQEYLITLRNCHTSLSVTSIKIFMSTKLDSRTEKAVFGTWDDKPMNLLLPIAAGETKTFSLHIYGKSEFLFTNLQDAETHSSARESYFDYNSVLSSDYSSITSHSNSFDVPVPNKVIKGNLKVQYSGGPGLDAGYCRVINVAVQADIVPSLIVTKWDVLPAETSFDFYLVLDVINQTSLEAELFYTQGKSLVVEAREFCRIPVLVPRCPLTKLFKLYSEPIKTNFTEIERICCEHIANNVSLKWRLSDGRNGILSLDGIHCTEPMLDIIRSSPIDWVLYVGGNIIESEEVSCNSGQTVFLSIKMKNKLPQSLTNLNLDIEFYQDHQNGVRNNKLDTRHAFSGCKNVIYNQLSGNETVEHRCTVIFFTPGQYRIGLQCFTVPSSTTDSYNIYSWKHDPAFQFCVI